MSLSTVGAITWMILTTSFIIHKSYGSNQHIEECPKGWKQFSSESPATCVWFSDDTTDDLNVAQDKCEKKNASLIIIKTETKFTFFKKLVKENDCVNTNVWIGLFRQWRGQIWWKSKGGKNVKANDLPRGLKTSKSWSDYVGLFYKDDKLIQKVKKHSWYYKMEGDLGRYLCEQQVVCEKGWFGEFCEHKCNCYNQECDPRSKNITCSFGCNVGWMGRNCTRKKEDADVRYFCVNSKDQGKYVQLIVDTKEVDYDKIDLVDDEGKWVTGCGNVVVAHTQKGNSRSSLDIKIFVGKIHFVETDKRHFVETDKRFNGGRDNNTTTIVASTTGNNSINDNILSRSDNNSSVNNSKNNNNNSNNNNNNSINSSSNKNNNKNNNNDEKQRKCKGKVSKTGTYEWKLKIQEHEYLVSRNDQEVHIECDFVKADEFTLSEETDIKRERWFRKSDIRKPIEYLDEKKEIVEMKVIDPSNEKEISDVILGNPVRLRVKYGVGKDSVAKGVRPYNCFAESFNGKIKVKFLDKNGCVLNKGFPISEFRDKGTKSLMTDPFPLFGFPGSESVQFSCSYVLCLGDGDCPVGCITSEKSGSPQINSRIRRSADDVERILKTTTSVRVIRN